MTTNVLIGIGGTGAKVVEAALYLLAAGAGPADKVIVGLVDQDNGNGNLARTNELVEQIRALRSSWISPKKNTLDWASNAAAGGIRFLRTDIQPLFTNTAHWRPADADEGTLAQILDKPQMPEGEKALFDLLFRREGVPEADEEQTMDLAEGYRGRAHVGSAAMLASLLVLDTSFTTRLSDLLGETTKGDDVRIFLAGSVFGGTGAAGFPTIARKIDNLRKQPEGDSPVDEHRVRLGGVLMLPYFAFQDTADRNANVVRSGDLLPQSRSAIAYYHRLFEHEPIFDRFYIAGWNELVRLAYHEAGTDKQKNPAMVPELIGALAALDFFATPIFDRTARPLASARANEGRFEWKDLPASAALYDSLGGLLRTALWWRYRIEPAFDNRRGGILGFAGGKEAVVGNIRQEWLRNLAAGTDWQLDTPTARQHLTAFFKGLLEWAASMQLFLEPAADRPMRLWDTDKLCTFRDRDRPTDPVVLHETMDEAGSQSSFEAILPPADPQAPLRRATALFADLHGGAPAGQSQGIGRVLTAVHRAARPLEQRG